MRGLCLPRRARTCVSTEREFGNKYDSGATTAADSEGVTQTALLLRQSDPARRVLSSSFSTCPPRARERADVGAIMAAACCWHTLVQIFTCLVRWGGRSRSPSIFHQLCAAALAGPGDLLHSILGEHRQRRDAKHEFSFISSCTAITAVQMLQGSAWHENDIAHASHRSTPENYCNCFGNGRHSLSVIAPSPLGPRWSTAIDCG